MKIDQKAKFAQREWDNPQLYPLKSQQNNFRCGWLKRKGNEYEIYDCGKPYRIAHTRIDEYLKDNIFENNFSHNKNKDLADEKKTTAYKYKLVEKFNLKNLNFDYDEKFSNKYNSNRVKVSITGNICGTIVLTGQPNLWKLPRSLRVGKFYEFVFEDKDEGVYSLDKLEFEHFKFIYSESSEWDRIKRSIDSEQGVPVFFRLENKKIKDFGIAYLYKLPYDKSPFDTLSEHHKNKDKEKLKLDLAECIFGIEKKKEALKGRVQIGNAICENGVPDNELIFTMGSPKASYYPIYIEQKKGSKGKVTQYSTYNDSKIKGWKRYQIRNSVYGNKKQNDYNDKLDTKLIPLKKGAEFNTKVRFHNLRPIELAALLSAITFHKTENCYHQLGQGKPYGLGKVKIEIVNQYFDRDFDIDEEFAKYEEQLAKQIGKKWSSSDEMIQLFTLVSVPVADAESVLYEYMKMSTTDRKSNDFLTAKEHNEYLQYYTALKGQQKQPHSFLDQYEKQFEEERKQKRALLEKERIEEEQRVLQQQAAEAVARRQEQIEGGLSFLEEKFDDGRYKVTDSKGINNRVNQWLKKANATWLPKEEYDFLYNSLKRIYEEANNREKRNWEDFNRGIWNSVKSWVDEDVAKEWFDKIIKP